ncbi:MAG: outer membrane protein transport protein [Elusimicrobia bacterium]|nr:outer membrane protein transport protein [Elusimicrobiota bacterium]
MKKRLSAVLGAVLASTMGVQSFALGTASYSSELISARSLGQGGTGVAGTQNDPIAVYTNPAALTEMKGTQATVGLSYVNASPKFKNAATSAGFGASTYSKGTAGDVTGARATSVAIPDFAITSSWLDGRVAAGLAAVTPYGLETHWDGDSPMRYQATDARLRMVDVTSALAYKVCSGFSIAAGLDYWNTVEGALEHKINVAALNSSLGGAAVGADANSRLNGNGDGFGYHVGTVLRFNARHQLGVVYHSAVRMALTGNAQIKGLSGTAATVFGGSNFSTDANAPLYIPQNVQVGYSYTPNERWNLEADASWYDWYAARQLGVVYQGNLTSTQASVLASGNPTEFKPRKTINFGFGANYKASDALQLRAGGYYQAAALPESYFDAAFVDLPRYAATLGAGWAVTKSLGMDFAYNAVFFHARDVNAPGAASSGSGYDGRFTSFANIVSASLTWRVD